MKITEKTKEKLGVFGEWVAYYSPLVVMFIFFYNQMTTITSRLDATNARIDQTIQITNARIDDCNKRADMLHQEFIDLLKEMKRQST